MTSSPEGRQEAAVEVVEATGIPFDLIEKVENRIAYRIALGSTPRAIAEDVLQIAALQAPTAKLAMDLVERLPLEILLDERDKFIVDQGLWEKFVATLPLSQAPATPDAQMEVEK